jgi:hypothetical protein
MAAPGEEDEGAADDEVACCPPAVPPVVVPAVVVAVFVPVMDMEEDIEPEVIEAVFVPAVPLVEDAPEAVAAQVADCGRSVTPCPAQRALAKSMVATKLISKFSFPIVTSPLWMHTLLVGFITCGGNAAGQICDQAIEVTNAFRVEATVTKGVWQTALRTIWDSLGALGERCARKYREQCNVERVHVCWWREGAAACFKW